MNSKLPIPSERSHSSFWPAWGIPFLVVLVLLGLWLHRYHALAWDELEFGRAAAWIRAGKVPYRDFWEHHAPLQWILAAPFAGHGAGVSGTLLLRWLQALLWVPGFWTLWRIMGEAGLGRRVRWSSLILLLASPFFFMQALEFRLDGLATLLLSGGVGLWFLGRGRRSLVFGGGVLMGLTVLANLRLAPVALLATLLPLVLDPVERRWGFQRRGLPAVVGALGVAGLAVLWLEAVHALEPCWRMAITDNYVAGMALIQHGHGLASRLFQGPCDQLDPAGWVFWFLAFGGWALAMSGLRRPGPLQALAILQAVHLVLTLRMESLYVYHFQTTLFLGAPFVALALHRLTSLCQGVERRRTWFIWVLAGLWVAIGIDAFDLIYRNTRPVLLCQDRILREAENRTLPGERIFDGCGWVAHREPAYRYWFLPTLVRNLVAKGIMEPYTPAQARCDPPAAIVFDIRLFNWFQEHPDLGSHMVHHYLPLYPHLWLPAMSGVLQPGKGLEWNVPRAGTYRLLASPALVGHPWFRQPLAILFYMPTNGFTAEVDPLNPALVPPPGLVLTVDGVPVEPRSGCLRLSKGSVLVLSHAPGGALGVMIVPEGAGHWFQGRAEGAPINAEVLLSRGVGMESNPAGNSAGS